MWSYMVGLFTLEELHVNLHPSTKLSLSEPVNLTEIFPPCERITRTCEASGSAQLTLNTQLLVAVLPLLVAVLPLLVAGLA